MSNNKEFVDSVDLAKAMLIEGIANNMQGVCLLIEGDAKKNCSVDMGELMLSIASDVEINEKNIKGVVGTPKKYAPFVHQGTGIYAINGDGRKTPWKYQDVKGAFHQTIGQKPNPFLEDAKIANMDKITSMLAGNA